MTNATCERECLRGLIESRAYVLQAQNEGFMGFRSDLKEALFYVRALRRTRFLISSIV